MKHSVKAINSSVGGWSYSIVQDYISQVHTTVSATLKLQLGSAGLALPEGDAMNLLGTRGKCLLQQGRSGP